MSRPLVILGLVIVAIGVFWPWLSRIGLGRLPGDVFIERENVVIYLPLTTGLIVGLVISAVFWLARR